MWLIDVVYWFFDCLICVVDAAISWSLLFIFSLLCIGFVILLVVSLIGYWSCLIVVVYCLCDCFVWVCWFVVLCVVCWWFVVCLLFACFVGNGFIVGFWWLLDFAGLYWFGFVCGCWFDLLFVYVRLIDFFYLICMLFIFCL